jgi:hypothetical protein
VNIRSNYRKILNYIQTDPRFRAVEKDIDKFHYFEEYMLELDRKEKQKFQERKQLLMDDFKSLLERRHKEGQITPKTLWRKLQPQLQGLPQYENLDKYDRLFTWDLFMRELIEKEDKEQLIEKEKYKKLEKKYKSYYWVS